MKYVLTIVAMFAVLPTLCSAEDLGAFGLGEVEVMSDAEGQNVRGLGIFARSTGATGISMNILDPNTGSQWNIFTTSFDSSDDSKLTTDVTSTPTTLGAGATSNAFVALDDITFDVDTTDTNGTTTNFGFAGTGIGAISQGAANGGAAGSFTFTVPTFTSSPF